VLEAESLSASPSVELEAVIDSAQLSKTKNNTTQEKVIKTEK